MKKVVMLGESNYAKAFKEANEKRIREGEDSISLSINCYSSVKVFFGILDQIRDTDIFVVNNDFCEAAGFELVEKIREKKAFSHCLIFIFTSRMFLSEKEEQLLTGIGTDYIVTGNLPPAFLLQRVVSTIKAEKLLFEKVAFKRNIIQESSITKEESFSEEKSIEEIVTEAIHQLGVPAHIKGYNYIREAITRAIKNPEEVNCITKVLYPEIAKKFGSTSSRVERAIRHAIEVSWKRADIDAVNKIFGYTIDQDKGKPTNSEFIALIADRIRLARKESEN